jgi:hypothetical protein
VRAQRRRRRRTRRRAGTAGADVRSGGPGVGGGSRRRGGHSIGQDRAADKPVSWERPVSLDSGRAVHTASQRRPASDRGEHDHALPHCRRRSPVTLRRDPDVHAHPVPAARPPPEARDERLIPACPVLDRKVARPARRHAPVPRSGQGHVPEPLCRGRRGIRNRGPSYGNCAACLPTHLKGHGPCAPTRDTDPFPPVR